MKLNINQLQQLFSEIEGKGTEIQGILKANSLNQGKKVALRKVSKSIQETMKLIQEQELALFTEYIDGFMTSEAKIKEGKSPEEFTKLHEELKTSVYEVEKADGLSVEDIHSITGTSDYYDILIQLQSANGAETP